MATASAQRVSDVEIVPQVVAGGIKISARLGSPAAQIGL
jgi:hypothetical protein